MEEEWEIQPAREGGYKKRRPGKKYWQYFCKHGKERYHCVHCTRCTTFKPKPAKGEPVEYEEVEREGGGFRRRQVGATKW